MNITEVIVTFSDNTTLQVSGYKYPEQSEKMRNEILNNISHYNNKWCKRSENRVESTDNGMYSVRYKWNTFIKSVDILPVKESCRIDFYKNEYPIYFPEDPGYYSEETDMTNYQYFR
jgi:hypothetical protein